MACYHKSPQDTNVTITGYNKSADGIVFYSILVKCSDKEWSISHRYNEFFELHEKLVKDYNVDKDWLPPKKPFDIKSNSFFEKRQEALQTYLQKILHYLQMTMPLPLVDFLHFHKYDIIFLLQKLAATFFNDGDQILFNSVNSYTFSALELHAISERLKMPCPTQGLYDKQYDYSHVLDFCSRLHSIIIVPKHNKNFENEASKKAKQDAAILPVSEASYEVRMSVDWNKALEEKIGSSDIVPSLLKFETSAFKNLKSLCIYAVPMENIYSTGNLRATLEHLTVNNTSCDQIKDILLCDSVHRDSTELYGNQAFLKVLTVNFDKNRITAIDESINLLPNLTELSLEENQLTDIDNLKDLCKLVSVNLCHNKIRHFTDWHLKLGNITRLNLAHNQIKKLSGLCKLLSLVNLDLSSNQVGELREVQYLSKLPILRHLSLNGNPLAATVVDYRFKVLAYFGERISDIILDNEQGTQDEIELAMAHNAMRIANLNINSDL